MGGSTKYTDEQINFVLDRAIQYVPRGELEDLHRQIVEEFLNRWDDMENFGIPQVRYIVERYGRDPQYGNRRVNVVRPGPIPEGPGPILEGAEGPQPPRTSWRAINVRNRPAAVEASRAEPRLYPLCEHCDGTGLKPVLNKNNQPRQQAAQNEGPTHQDNQSMSTGGHLAYPPSTAEDPRAAARGAGNGGASDTEETEPEESTPRETRQTRLGKRTHSATNTPEATATPRFPTVSRQPAVPASGRSFVSRPIDEDDYDDYSDYDGGSESDDQEESRPSKTRMSSPSQPSTKRAKTNGEAGEAARALVAPTTGRAVSASGAVSEGQSSDDDHPAGASGQENGDDNDRVRDDEERETGNEMEPGTELADAPMSESPPRDALPSSVPADGQAVSEASLEPPVQNGEVSLSQADSWLSDEVPMEPPTQNRGQSPILTGSQLSVEIKREPPSQDSWHSLSPAGSQLSVEIKQETPSQESWRSLSPVGSQLTNQRFVRGRAPSPSPVGSRLINERFVRSRAPSPSPADTPLTNERGRREGNVSPESMHHSLSPRLGEGNNDDYEPFNPVRFSVFDGPPLLHYGQPRRHHDRHYDRLHDRSINRWRSSVMERGPAPVRRAETRPRPRPVRENGEYQSLPRHIAGSGNAAGDTENHSVRNNTSMDTVMRPTTAYRTSASTSASASGRDRYTGPRIYGDNGWYNAASRAASQQGRRDTYLAQIAELALQYETNLGSRSATGSSSRIGSSHLPQSRSGFLSAASQLARSEEPLHGGTTRSHRLPFGESSSRGEENAQLEVQGQRRTSVRNEYDARFPSGSRDNVMHRNSGQGARTSSSRVPEPNFGDDFDLAEHMEDATGARDWDYAIYPRLRGPSPRSGYTFDDPYQFLGVSPTNATVYPSTIVNLKTAVNELLRCGQRASVGNLMMLNRQGRAAYNGRGE
ncbi:hypothetical protein F4778DRAFT_778924 [Xylariomycetidae sp. FL2044]|nr:hypothetical protein F4778DRAFT_778924 [Xylariomycetidae sp. FL2044]